MRRMIVALLVSVAMLLALPAAVLASPPIGGSGAHPHHVHTGDGECVEIDAVHFNPEERGLHNGAHESGNDKGPWHGPCHS